MLSLLHGTNVCPAIIKRAEAATSDVSGERRLTLRNGMPGWECLGNPSQSTKIPLCAAGKFYN
jgi:hypothetical protein